MGRKVPDLGIAFVSGRRYIDYINVSALSGVVISRRYASLYELQEVYGTEDMYNLYEIIAVNNHNEYLASLEK